MSTGKKMAPPIVKTPTPWPCDSPQPGEVVECPGSANNSLCKQLIQIRAGTNADKPSFGKLFVMHPTDDGGCGYFSYLKLDKENNQVLLEEAVYQRSKRKMAVSRIPEGDIDPTDGGSVAKRRRVDALEEQIAQWSERITKLETTRETIQKQIQALFSDTLDIMQRIYALEKNKPRASEELVEMTSAEQGEEGEIPAVTQPLDLSDDE